MLFDLFNQKHRSHIRSPRDDSILKVSRVSVSNSSTDENFRSILHEALIKVMKVTIALHTNDTVHDKSATDFHLQHRAEQSVRQELETIMDRMDRQTTTGNHMYVFLMPIMCFICLYNIHLLFLG